MYLNLQPTEIRSGLPIPVPGGTQNMSALSLRQHTGCGCGGSGLGDLTSEASVLGGLSVQTVANAAGVGFVLYKSFFSNNAKARRSALSQASSESKRKRRAIRQDFGYV